MSKGEAQCIIFLVLSLCRIPPDRGIEVGTCCRFLDLDKPASFLAATDEKRRPFEWLMRIETTDHDNSRLMERIVILLGGVIVALLIVFCYFAAAFCITIILASFLSILVDPLVSACERWIPRAVSAAVLIVAGMLLLGSFSLALFNRASRISDNLPFYAERIQSIVGPIVHKITTMEETAGKLGADGPYKKVPEVKVRQAPSWPVYLLRGFGSLSTAMIVLGVVPFLMFFMLVQKEKWYNTAAYVLGPKHDPDEFAARLASIVRRFLLGNLVAEVLLAGITMLLLSAFELRGAFVIGVASGALNLIPFLGVIFAALIPMTAAVMQSVPIETVLLIGAVVVIMHIITANLVIPRFIGPRINIGPVAATAGILFWGWLWGIFGIFLALPLTGIVKLLVDYHPGLTPFSTMLGASTPPASPPDATKAAETSMTATIEVTK